MKFEQLLSELSHHLLAGEDVEFDEIVNQFLEKVRQFFNAGRVLFVHYKEDWQFFQVLYTAAKPERTLGANQMEFRRMFPGISKMIFRGDSVIIPSIEPLPPEMEQDRQTLSAMGTRSLYVIPIQTKFGNTYGISISSEAEFSLPDEKIPRLRLLGEMLAGALERRQAYHSLQEAEKKYRTIADFTYDMECWHDRSGKLLFVSPSCLRITGFSDDELLSDPDLISRIIHPDDKATWQEHLLKTEMLPGPQELSVRILAKDGTIKWLEQIDNPVMDENGQYMGIRSSSRDITERVMFEQNLERALEEIKDLKQQLEAENIYLKDVILPKIAIPGIIAQSDAMKKVLEQVHQVAPTDTAVLVTGETGTGKELIARMIHQLSSRSKKIMITVNCAALPASLIESELFGREKGAYTGALTRQAGRFEMANHSTIFLDEIGEMPVEVQVKLLRILQFGEFERIGSPETHKTNVRIIAATNKDLKKALDEGMFRKDLYYRLNVFPIHIPPLRDRLEDIAPLVWTFVNELVEKTGKRIDTIPRKVMEKLTRYSWPGNVRELRNIIEHAMIITTSRALDIALPTSYLMEDLKVSTMEEMERFHILTVLKQTHWRVRGEGGAAQILGLNEATLRFRMKKLGIRRPE